MSQHLNFCQVVFEGMNRSGKTTTKTAFEKLTNYKYITIDRGLITGLVMTELFKRPKTTYDLEQFKKVIFIYLYTDDEEINKRYIETNHEEFPIKEERELFEKHVDEMRKKGLKILSFNTSLSSPEEIASHISSYAEGLNA